jgi:hypothetical protein
VAKAYGVGGMVLPVTVCREEWHEFGLRSRMHSTSDGTLCEGCARARGSSNELGPVLAAKMTGCLEMGGFRPDFVTLYLNQENSGIAQLSAERF